MKLHKMFVGVLMLASGLVFAATTGELILTGQVNTVFSLAVTANSSASSLNIEGGESSTTVASVNEQTNNPGGYKITVASDNNGKLIHNSDTNSFVNYQISYAGGTGIQPTTAAQQVKTVSSLSTPANVNSSVAISFTGKQDALGGTYGDRLVFEIAAP